MKRAKNPVFLHNFRSCYLFWNIIMFISLLLKMINQKSRGRGGTHIFRQTGMYRSEWVAFFFTRNPLTWVPFFTKKKKINKKIKSLNMGPIFWLSPNFQVFTWWNPENRKICEKCRACKKNPQQWYPFLPKLPLKTGRGFEARAAHPCPTEYPQGGGALECQDGVSGSSKNSRRPPK